MENERPWSKTLKFIFNVISSSNKKEKFVNILRLQNFVTEQIQRLKNENFMSFMNDVNLRISNLMSSTDTEKMELGVLTLDALVELEYDCNDYDFVTQWMNLLFKAIHESKDVSVSEMISKCFGNLVRTYQEVLSHDYLDMEIHECLTYLSKNVKQSELKLITAISVMESLLDSVPNLVSLVYVENFLSLVELNLGSSSLQMRVKMVKVIGRSLELIKRQLPEQRNASYKKVFKVVEKYLYTKNLITEKLDGALMTLAVLSTQSGSFLDDKIPKLFRKILQVKDNPNLLVRKSLMELLIVLAEFYPGLIAGDNLNTLVKWLVGITVNPGEQRDLAFRVLAKMTLLLKKSMLPQLEIILNAINFSFFLHSKLVGSKLSNSQIGSTAYFGSNVNNIKYFHTDIHSANTVSNSNSFSTTEAFKSTGADKLVSKASLLKDFGSQSLSNGSLTVSTGGDSILSVMECLSALVQVFDTMLTESIKSLLPLIFETKISVVMVNLLSTISKKIPYYEKNIQSSLFQIVSRILIGYQPEQVLDSNASLNAGTSILSKVNGMPFLRHDVPGSSIVTSKVVAKQMYSRSKIIGKTLKNLFSAKSVISSKNPIKEASLKNNSTSHSTLPIVNRGALAASKITEIITALDTISTFCFDPKFYPLNHLCDLALPYLDHEVQLVKSHAVVSCKNILVKYVKTFFLIESDNYSLKMRRKNTFGSNLTAVDNVAELKKIFNFSGQKHVFVGRAIFGHNQFVSSYGCHFVNNFLESLFQFAFGNTDLDARIESLTCLEECFDPFLCQNRFLSYLFLFVNDSAFEISKISLIILGRLSLLNPGKILPFARSHLLNLMKKLTAAQQERLNFQENACRLLSVTIEEFPSLATLFIDSIIKTLMKLVKELESFKVVSYVLCAIGDIAKSCGHGIDPYLDDIIPLLIEMIQDRFSPFKRKNALQALIDVIEYSGHVVDPYFKYPELIVMVLDKIVKEAQLKSLFGRLLGVLGALDPYLYKLICEKGESISESYKLLLVKGRGNNTFYENIKLNHKKHPNFSSNNTNSSHNRNIYSLLDNKLSLNTSAFVLDRLNDSKSIPISNASSSMAAGKHLLLVMDPSFSVDIEYDNALEGQGSSSEWFYAAFVLNCLLKFFNSPYDKQVTLIQSALQCSMDILIYLKSKASSFLYYFIPVWKNLTLVCSDPQLKIPEIIFKNLKIITTHVKHFAKDHISSIMDMCLPYFDSPLLTLHLIALFEKLSLAIGDQFKTCLDVILPKMIHSIQNDQSEDYRITQRILVSWQVYGHLDQFTYIIVPTLASLLNEMVLQKTELKSSASDNFSSRSDSISTFLIDNTHKSVSESSFVPSNTSSAHFFDTVNNTVLNTHADYVKSIIYQQPTSLSSSSSSNNFVLPTLPHSSKKHSSHKDFDTTAKKAISHKDSDSNNVKKLNSHKKQSENEKKLSVKQAIRVGDAVECSVKSAKDESVLMRQSESSRYDEKGEKKIFKISGSNALSGVKGDQYFVREYPLSVKKAILCTLSNVASNNKNVSQYCLVVLHPMIRLLSGGIESEELLEVALETLVKFAIELEKSFAVFVPAVRSCLKSAGLSNDMIQLVFSSIWNKDPHLLTKRQANLILDLQDDQIDLCNTSNVNHVDENELDVSHGMSDPQFDSIIICISNAFSCFSVSDWVEWIKVLCINLLKNSNVAPLTFSTGFVQIYQSFVYKLFKLAFFACWNRFSPDQRSTVIRTVSNMLSLDRIPIHILQLQLDMIEYMEHHECDFNIDLQLLSELATKCRAHARALYYKERYYRTYLKNKPYYKLILSNYNSNFTSTEIHDEQAATDEQVASSLTVIEDLISIYHQLEYYDSAQGMLQMVQNIPRMKSLNMDVDDENASVYGSGGGASALSRDLDLPLCRMRCYHGLGKWEVLLLLCDEQWKKREQMDAERCMQVASLALSASLNLSRWSHMDKYICALSEETSDGSFYRAVHALWSGNDTEFLRHFVTACDLTTIDLKNLLQESYSRAYPMIVRMQQLVELEEVYQYHGLQSDFRKKHQNSDRNRIILSNMELRLTCVQPKVDNWQRLLNVRFMLENPHCNLPLWTKFGNLAMKKNRPRKANQIFCSLLNDQNSSVNDNELGSNAILNYSILSSMYSLNETRENAIRKMEQWTLSFSDNTTNISISRAGKAKCYLKLVKWKFIEMGNRLYDQEIADYLLGLTREAIKCDYANYKAWRMFATLNSKILLQIEKNLITSKNIPLPSNIYGITMGDEECEKVMSMGEGGETMFLGIYVRFFAHGLIESIRYSPKESLEDLLQLMFLWFKYGSNTYFESIILDSIRKIPIVKWLAVIPQLFSHINVPIRAVRSGLENVLMLIGKYHPQAIAFAINFDKNSFSMTRVRASQKLEQLLRGHCSLIMDESQLVCSELNRVAFLLKEKFCEGIQDAYRYYYYEKNIGEMVNILEQLNSELQNEPETYYELTFHQAFKRDLDEAWRTMSRYLKARSNEDLLAKSWEWYVQVFREIRKSLEREDERFNLKNVSPRLFKLKNLGLCVPGTYKYNVMEDDDDEKCQFKNSLTLSKNASDETSQHEPSYRLLSLHIGDTFNLESFLGVSSGVANSNEDLHAASITAAAQHGSKNASSQFDLHDYFCSQGDRLNSNFFTTNHSLSKLFFDHFSIFSNCSNFYNSNVCIRRFSSTVKLIKSKQCPKKIIVYGNDGREYGFLLKAREDLRQDERVMQLFNLLNMLLNRVKKYNTDLLYIRTFSIIPISPNVGLIEWVPYCDTIYSIIKSYRMSHNIPLNAERNIMCKYLPSGVIENYYLLTDMQKLELFQISLDATSEADFERAMYFNSKNSENWLEKRFNYTQSLALMSIVGYILGLGDRHPNNFLLCRKTGVLIHIDFADCFEVTINRENFPEKVPFRLTRMFIAALDVAGVNGIFKLTCERVMKILRQNSDSILSVLRSFVNDPSLNWRLVPTYLKYRTNVSLPISNLPTSNSPDDSRPFNDIFLTTDNDSLYDLYRPQRILPSSIDSQFEISLNDKTKQVLKRISSKLNGNEFPYKGHLDEHSQVSLLIKQATNNENLSCCYLGFCSFW